MTQEQDHRVEPTPIPIPSIGEGREIQCEQCQHLKPVDDYERWPRRQGHVHSVCKVCVSRNELAVAREQSHFEHDRPMPCPPEMVQLGIPVISAIIDRDIEPPNIHDLADGMTGRMGGLNGFCDFWTVNLRYAASIKPGSKTVLDGCKHLANLIFQSSQLRQQGSDVGSMSDEDLERIIVEHLQRTATHEPRTLTAGDAIPTPGNGNGVAH